MRAGTILAKQHNKTMQNKNKKQKTKIQINIILQKHKSGLVGLKEQCLLFHHLIPYIRSGQPMARGLHVVREQFLCGLPGPQRKNLYGWILCVLCKSCGCSPRQKSQLIFWAVVVTHHCHIWLLTRTSVLMSDTQI